MKTEAVKTIFKSEDYGLEDHTLTVDKIVELDENGNAMVKMAKKMLGIIKDSS